MKKILKVLGYGVLAVVVGGVVVVLSNYALFKRLATVQSDAGPTKVDWYQPLERVLEGPPARIVEGDPQSAGISVETVRAAIDYGTEMRSVALLVQHKGKLLVEHYWPGFGVDSRTDPASMHKSVMTLLIGTAIADGFIGSLDDPVAKYLQDWTGEPEGEIPLKALLQMSSGLENAPPGMNPFGKWMQLLLGTDIAETALEFELVRPPLTEFAYNNVDSQLLGMVLEAATGQRYAQYLSQRLWSQIGAPRAFVWLDDDEGMPHTFCCLQTTARGWLAVGNLLLNDGKFNGAQVVPTEYLREALTPAATNPNYGYQIWLGNPYTPKRRYSAASPLTVTHSAPYLADDLYFFDGFGGQRVYVVPSADLVIIRTGETRMDWDDTVLPNLFLKDIQQG